MIIFIYWLTAYSSYGQRFNSKISLKVSNLPSITAKLDSFQSLGVKVDRSLALENTGEWLKNEISQLGLNPQFDSFITTVLYQTTNDYQRLSHRPTALGPYGRRPVSRSSSENHSSDC